MPNYNETRLNNFETSLRYIKYDSAQNSRIFLKKENTFRHQFRKESTSHLKKITIDNLYSFKN
jgi:hypothetical protein